LNNNYNYKIIIQFDGTNYSGWQYQGGNIRTIQEELIRVLTIIAKKKVNITGSSRTDAGVHSLGLTANFFLPIRIEPASMVKALNSLLPKDICISHCQLMDKSFNARFGAAYKVYTYKIFKGQIISPFIYRYFAHIPYPLNLPKMRQAVKYFIGMHDFSSFTSDEPHKNRLREIDSFSMKVKKDEIIFTIQGKSFLRYMVRNMVGTIIDVGREKIELGDLPEIFAAKDRRRAGQTAPAQGLTLTKVEYSQEALLS
jgi:tRNA pseudouridine38-40 synthase